MENTTPTRNQSRLASESVRRNDIQLIKEIVRPIDENFFHVEEYFSSIILFYIRNIRFYIYYDADRRVTASFDGGHSRYIYLTDQGVSFGHTTFISNRDGIKDLLEYAILQRMNIVVDITEAGLHFISEVKKQCKKVNWHKEGF